MKAVGSAERDVWKRLTELPLNSRHLEAMPSNDAEDLLVQVLQLKNRPSFEQFLGHP